MTKIDTIVMPLDSSEVIRVTDWMTIKLRQKLKLATEQIALLESFSHDGLGCTAYLQEVLAEMLETAKAYNLVVDLAWDSKHATL